MSFGFIARGYGSAQPSVRLVGAIFLALDSVADLAEYQC